MKNLVLVGLSLTVLGGCTSSAPVIPSEVIAYRSPVNGHEDIRRVRPATVITGYQNRPVVEPVGWKRENAVPASWRDQNVDAEATETDEKPVNTEVPKP